MFGVIKLTIHKDNVRQRTKHDAMTLLLVCFAGGFMSPAFGETAQAQGASSVASSSAPLVSADSNAQLLNATQGLVQALVKSVQQQTGKQAGMMQSAGPAIPPGAVAMMRAADAQDASKNASAPAAIRSWTVPRDAQLQDVLTDWCRRAGWTLVWQSEYSYRIEAEANFNGDFLSAVTSMLTALSNVSPPIYPEIYKGNRVVVIKNNPTR